MTIELITKGGSGGAPTTLSLGVYTRVASGASGTLITIPSVAGQRPVLTNLFVDGSTQETGITINVGGNPVISGAILDDNNASRGAGTFCIGNRGAGADEPPIYGDEGDIITVVKDSGSTIANIDYSFRYVR